MGDVAAGNGGASAATSLGELETTVELSDLIETARTGTLTSLTDVSAQGWSDLHCPLHCTARHTHAVMEWTHTLTHTCMALHPRLLTATRDRVHPIAMTFLSPSWRGLLGCTERQLICAITCFVSFSSERAQIALCVVKKGLAKVPSECSSLAPRGRPAPPAGLPTLGYA